jgi:hypothetical protein
MNRQTWPRQTWRVVHHPPRNAQPPEMFHKFWERITDCARSLSGIGQWGVSMSADQYRRQAEECFRTAERATNPDTRLDLIELAQSWLLLADQADKNLAAELVYGPPPSHNEVAGAAVAQQQQQIQPKKED